jgi:hypothetical protein
MIDTRTFYATLDMAVRDLLALPVGYLIIAYWTAF